MDNNIKDTMQNNMDFSEQYGALTMLKVMINTTAAELDKRPGLPGYSVLTDWLVDLYNKKNAQMVLDFANIIKNTAKQMDDVEDEE